MAPNRKFVLLISGLFSSLHLFSQTFWQPFGFQDTSITSLVINKNGKMVSSSFNLSGKPSFHYSENLGESWLTMNVPEIFPSRMAIDQNGNIYISDDDGTEKCLILSSDSGKSWENIADTSVMSNYSLGISPSGKIYTSFAFKNGNNIYLHTSSDLGKTWQKQKVENQPSLLSNLNSQSVFVFDILENALYISNSGIYKLDIGSGLWVKKIIGMDQPFIRTMCMTSEGILYAHANFNATYKSDNLGESWSKITTAGLPQFATFDQLISSPSGLYGIVHGTQKDGIYRSKDSGNTWENVSSGMELNGFLSAAQILAVASNGELFCGTNQGLFKSTMTLTGLSEYSKVKPDIFKLNGSYPNPFNPTAKVQFTLPTSGLVEFSVFNTLGQLISTKTIAGVSGLSSEIFNANNLPSGLYLYQIRFNNQMLHGSMTLVK